MNDNKLLYKKMGIEELVVFSQKDDFRALESLIKKIQHDVFATISFLTPNNEYISDITQEVLLKVAKNIHSLKNPKCFKGWLNQIITHSYYDEMRKQKRIPEMISIDCGYEDLNFKLNIDIPDKKSKPFEKCVTSECEKIIKAEIQKLPETFKIAIILRELQGLTYDEIAHMTHSSIGTVKSRISRARIKLQENLKNYI